ncbi:peptidase M50 [Coriobacterium glomerans PW2]|uniref:Peptidase M50 n=1 Tax=Coriobacterium glomerans (strain ATCC 49209 / DSM 20642 / JCM 10262 / PW2) TaxID=700015 RepID=F2N9I4_CORGP|nr:site-2 protease family protein [Coriobacterium glomerans]AEB07013.1 peptidase M50 [Coriobacterium glomerans PW2]
MYRLSLYSIIISVLALIIGIVVHESAHALAAYLLGDATARSRGRVSLNPLNHIDPFGTVLLPLLMIAMGGPVFAFAKPVPVQVNNLRHPKRDELLVSLAGPASNIVIACLFTLLLRLVLHSVAISSATDFMVRSIMDLSVEAIQINLALAFFNLIPIPPLDGSAILVVFLKGQALRTYYEIQRYAMFALLIMLFVLPQFFRIDLISLYFSVTVYPVFHFLLSFAMGLV